MTIGKPKSNPSGAQRHAPLLRSGPMPEQSARTANGGNGHERAPADLAADLSRIVDGVRGTFEVSRRVLSFGEYLELYAKSPAQQGRDSSRYIRDMFLHYGTTTVEKPWGKRTPVSYTHLTLPTN